jgi:hypothetical protein
MYSYGLGAVNELLGMFYTSTPVVYFQYNQEMADSVEERGWQVGKPLTNAWSTF